MNNIPDLNQAFTNHMHSIKYSPKTIALHQRNVDNFYQWLNQAYQLKTIDQLRFEHLKKWHEHFSNRRTSKGYPLKARYINILISSIRVFIQFLIKENYADARLLNALPYLKEPQKLPTSFLTHAQVKKLLASINKDTSFGYRNRVMLEILYSTGIRAGELVKLSLDDVDLKNHTLLINGKGDKQRMVPIGKTALEYLETYIVAVRPYLMPKKGEKALFLSRFGKRMGYDSFKNIMGQISKQANLNIDITAHTFRRSCTTELIRGGANMYHVKELLGHESLDTLKPYVKLTITDLKKTHEKCHPRERDDK